MSKVATTKTATKTTKTTKSLTPVTETTDVGTTDVGTTEVTATEVTEVTATEVPSVTERLEDLVRSRQAMIETLKREVVTLRKLIKDQQAELKLASKGRKKKATNPDAKPRKPSGFAEPVVVSDHMYSFLTGFGVKKGTPIARTDITKFIIEYIKKHNLQNPERRREIVPDTVLSKLFGPAMEHRDPNDTSSPKVYSYLKLQKYLSSHFPKKKVATDTVTATATATATH
jgi:chromatin remodeling complex protein RSC6